MHSKSIRNRLQNISTPLSKSEERIAQYVLKHIDEVVTAPISELAQKIPTSPSTITRFCQKLLYKNYIEFQTLLKNELEQPQESDSSVQSINEYYQEINEISSEIIQTKDIQVITSAIQKANKIVIIGIGSSGLTAQELASRLNHMGLFAVAITDSYTMISQALLLNEGDLLIAISNYGRTKEIIESIQTATDRKVSTLALTKINNTPLTELAASIVFTGYPENINTKNFFNDQLSVLFLIDVVTYELLKNEKFQQTFDYVTKGLIEKDL